MSIVLIGGTGRSGTNLIRKVLSKGSNVSSPNFETRYTVDPNGILPFLRALECSNSPFYIDYLLKEHIKFLFTLAQRSSFKVALNKIIKKIPNNHKEQVLTGFAYAEWELEKHFPDYFKNLNSYRNRIESFKFDGVRPGFKELRLNPEMYYIPRQSREAVFDSAKNFILNNIKSTFSSECSVYVDDNTYNLVYASTYQRLFPDAKFIHVRRSPLDVVASYVCQRWCPKDPSKSAVLIQDLLSIIDNELALIPAENVMTICLENLVQNHRQQIEKICEFSNIDFDGKMLDIDLSRHNIGRYKRQFTSTQILELESILSKEIAHHDELVNSETYLCHKTL